jgi:hypothetical protein
MTINLRLLHPTHVKHPFSLDLSLKMRGSSMGNNRNTIVPT